MSNEPVDLKVKIDSFMTALGEIQAEYLHPVVEKALEKYSAQQTIMALLDTAMRVCQHSNPIDFHAAVKQFDELSEVCRGSILEHMATTRNH